eukprot:TRINITY_DN4307_c0_g1_i5.p1 TRINITY_DN4307_c0_g1~~TRINITY_DN4307_c0_g1_i5.p1  ORF type:complete len:377 (-),score=85.57 TRINITY_DN4307_c0_g1_i5:228-1358(-)
MRRKPVAVKPNVIQKKWKVKELLGSGSFGEVHRGEDVKNGIDVAIKFESRSDTGKRKVLPEEARIYKHLGGAEGFPKLIWAGPDGDYYVMVMTLLGPSIGDLFESDLCGYRFSLKTVLQIAIAMIDRLEKMHSKNYLHRDLKPKNLVMGVGNNAHKVYLLDLGLAKRYIDKKTGQHIPEKDGLPLVGTPKYASVNNHFGRELGRRDDLESLGYILLLFLKGSLPWDGIAKTPNPRNRREKYIPMGAMKDDMTPQQLFRHYPEEFVQYMEYVRNLEFDSTPNYKYLKKLFERRYQNEFGKKADKLYDWDIAMRRKNKGKKLQSFSSDSSSYYSGTSDDSDESDSTSESTSTSEESEMSYGNSSDVSSTEDSSMQSTS